MFIYPIEKVYTFTHLRKCEDEIAILLNATENYRLAFHHTICKILPMISAYAENQPVLAHLTPTLLCAQCEVDSH